MLPETDEALLKVMGELELLDASWKEWLTGSGRMLRSGTVREDCFGPMQAEAEAWFARLASYFLFRYSIDAFRDHDEAMEFRLLQRSLRFLFLMCALRVREKGSFTREDMIDLAHIYSRQVEHSEENAERIKLP